MAEFKIYEMSMKVRYTPIGSYGTNCCLLIDEQSGECAAVDCGIYDDTYKDFIKKVGITKLKYILLTHGHFDHICGVKELKENYGGEICIHAEDATCLTDEKQSLNFYSHYAEQSPVEADIILKDGDSLFLGENKISVMHTPGHTRGSVCFITEGVIFSGDTLFRCSMGRTDMPGGSTRQLFNSLAAIGKIPGEYDIFPGHGELTTLSFEKANNRFLRVK